MQHRQLGFTLIEIAIVLVIIGILLGGVLKGQEMIMQGNIRSVQKQIESIGVAVHNYRDRYQALPGDDPQANGRWDISQTGTANGRIDGMFNSNDDAEESRLAWLHLRHAGFISGDPADSKQPRNAAGGLSGIQTDLSVNSTPALSGTVVCTTNLPAKIANAIDSSQDDGLPDKGRTRGFKQEASDNPDFGEAITAYEDKAGLLYTVCMSI